MRLFRMISIAALVASTSIMADNSGETYIIGQASRLNTDSDRNLDTHWQPGVGIGYNVNERWSVEANYFNGDTEIDNSDTDVDSKVFRADALYHLMPGGKWDPYAIGGLSRHAYDPDNSSDDEYNALNLGIGLARELTDKLSLRGDYRVMREFGEGDLDKAFTLGLTYAFGQAKTAQAKATPTAYPKAPTVQAAPEATIKAVSPKPATPAPAPTKVEEMIRVALNVKFGTDLSAVTTNYSEDVALVAEFMRTYTNTNATIEGHTDCRGTSAHNQALSEQRANAVVQTLTSEYGIARNRLRALGKGEPSPELCTSDAAAMAEQRQAVTVLTTTIWR